MVANTRIADLLDDGAKLLVERAERLGVPTLVLDPDRALDAAAFGAAAFAAMWLSPEPLASEEQTQSRNGNRGGPQPE